MARQIGNTWFQIDYKPFTRARYREYSGVVFPRQARMDIQTYAIEQVMARLEGLASQITAAAEDPGADAVHDLRVAIRRFSQSLRIFESVLPRKESRKIRKRLGGIMTLAGEIRDRDIALEFLADAKLSKSDVLWKQVASDRRSAEKDLIRRVKRCSRADFPDKWRSSLRLNPE